MPKSPRVLYGFEHETMAAKVRSFLKLTPAERIKCMMEFMESTRAIAQANPKSRSPKSLRVIRKKPVRSRSK